TPLARIKFAMAVIGSTAPIAAELGSIEEDVREIDRLIGTMLEFARLDHPHTRVQWQVTPADEWLQQAAGKPPPRADGTVRRTAQAERIRMDPGLLELELSHPLVNVGRYAKHDVADELTATDDGCPLAVDDDGPGIPDADRETVFKPFTRLDDSRSRGTGGYGLGLAIVARIAELHGGTARAERSALGGARIVISWPN